MTQSHHEQTRANRCAQCQGWLEYIEDRNDPHIRCVNCGRRIDVEQGATDPHPQGVEDPRPDRRWYPTSPETQDRYRRRREIIFNEELSLQQAMRRFQVSRRTIYRILDGRKPPA